MLPHTAYQAAALILGTGAIAGSLGLRIVQSSESEKEFVAFPSPRRPISTRVLQNLCATHPNAKERITISILDRMLNEESLASGGRLRSIYKTLAGEVVWIVTEGDRSKTTLMLPNEDNTGSLAAEGGRL